MLCYNCLKYGGKMPIQHEYYIPYTEPKHHHVKDVQPLKTTEKKTITTKN